MVADLNSECKKIPYERISGNFSDFTNFGHFWILAVLQNIWDLHKFGLQIWIQNAKITLWKNFGQFFPISPILVIRSGYAKKDHISILAVIQKIWTYINLGCRFEFRMQKLPYERISGNFFDFIDFGYQVRVCKKKITSQY